MDKAGWSKAPEGATHLVTESDGFARWMKKEGDCWFAWFWTGHCWGWNWVHVDGARAATFIARPDTTPAWTGEGLPPVGTACLDNSGSQIVIVAHHANGTHAIFAEAMDSRLLYYGAAGDFRPIRTPEQIAADEREAAIVAMCALIAGADDDIDCATRLYDAGCRMPEGGAQ